MPTLEEQLELHEGRRTRPYLDTGGKLTIGVGRNLRDVPLGDDEIDLLLANDVARATKGAQSCFTPTCWQSLSPIRQRVLIDMAFNLGTAGLMTFRRLRQAAELGDWDQAAREMLASRWATQVGHRAARLATMMQTNEDYST